MKKQRKISTIRLMMISSQLLLSLFLGYWLYTQFSDHKKLLVEDMERGINQSEQQVVDSMLSTHLINPILQNNCNLKVCMINEQVDTSGFISDFKYKKDTASQMVISISGDAGFSDMPVNRQQIIKSETNSTIKDKQQDITIRTIQDTSNQLMLQSVRLLISSVEKLTTDNDSLSTYFVSNIDTTLLKSLFNSFLATNYPGFSVDWSGKAGNKTFPGIPLTGQMFKNSYRVIINNYQGYLLKAISPQIVFAVLLLLITSLAFRMSYVSLKNQRKLLLLKNDFISNISHELKTPVSTVKVALEALLDFDLKKDPKLTKEYLEMAHSEMNRLDLLVSQVLNNSALEDGNKFIFPEKINLTTLVKDVLYTMQSQCNRLDAEINFETNNENITVNADRLHIHGVLVNLIDNSLKYCKNTPKISIILTEEKQEIKLTVSDNGIGIPDEYSDKVFDKFFRVPTEGKHDVKGYGLGLNYALLVMQHHHGSISVTGNVQGGCLFTLCFPKIQQ